MGPINFKVKYPIILKVVSKPKISIVLVFLVLHKTDKAKGLSIVTNLVLS
jgi:hypothetical protein